MIALVIGLVLTVLAQVEQPPVPLPGQPRPDPPAPAPQPSPVQVLRDPEFRTAFGELVVSGADAVVTAGANGEFELLDKAFDTPDALLNRTRENTVDDPHGAQLNDGLLRLLPGLVLAAMMLVATVNLVGVFTGAPVGPIGGLLAITVVALGALAAVNNRLLLGLLVDAVQLVLHAVGTTPIREFARPGMGIASFTAPIIGAILALAYGLVLLLLLVVLTIEIGWVVVLSSLAQLWVLASFTPKVSGIGGHFFMRWAGSLLSPVVALAALNLGALVVGKAGSQVAPGDQLMRLIYLLIAYQAPGFVAGAIAVAFPGFADVYRAGRLIGFGRYAPPASSARARPAPVAPAPTIPVVSVRAGGLGAGTAVTTRGRRPS